MSAWAWLAAAIGAEVVATSALKASDGFRNLIPSALAVAGYAFAFYGLSLSLKTLPLGIVYAIWSGVGTVGAVMAGRWLFGEALVLPQYLGMALVLAGVVLIETSRKGAL
jgi:small multidrug resistance pump